MIRTVGNYKLLQELGEGAMGTVYRALDMQLEREVALKSLRSELARRPDIVDRFREEAKLQGKLENIHIVRLYQFLREGNEFFMVMEFVKGKTLSSLLHERRRLPAAEAITIMEQALSGLGYAHKRNIVHRDIKPANIMINEDEIVKVADFGIARLVGSARQTKLGSIVGTLEYISPEAVQGNDATAVSDIYSCGILLYELLSGRLPFESPNEYELARAQVKDKPPALRQYAPDVPPRLEKAVMRALSKKPADRFQSAAQMAQELKSCMPGQGAPEAPQEKSFWNKLWSSSSSPDSEDTQILSGLQIASPEPRRQSPLLESDESSLRLRNTALQELSRQVDDFLNQRNWIRARQEVEKMTALYPREPALVEMSNRIAREQKHYDETLQIALREARNLLDRGLPDAAKKAIELSLQRFPSDPDLSALMLRAEAELAVFASRSSEVKEVVGRVDQLLADERHAEAIASAAEAMARFPNQPEVTALLGRAVKSQKMAGCRQQVENLRRTSQWDAALTAIDQTLALYRDEPLLVELRQGVLEERECDRQSREAESILARAAELQQNGQPDAAENAIHDAVARLPKAAAPISARMLETREALAKARYEKLAAAAVAEARSFERRREWQRAIDVINAAIPQAPGVSDLENVRREIEQSREKYVTGLRNALSEGRALLDANRFEDALVSLSSSSQIYPDETGFTELLLEAQQKLTAERRARQLNADRTRASELLAAEAFEEAEQFLLDAISQFPDDARLTDLLSSAIRGHREQEKKRTVERAISSAKQYAGKNLYEDGIHALDEALAVYPAEPALEAHKRDLTATLREHRRVERVQELKGWAASGGSRDFDAARAAVDAALVEYPNDPDFSAIRAEIETARRAFERSNTEREVAARTSDLESQGKYDEALNLTDAELAKFPESEFITGLKKDVLARREEAERFRLVAEAERHIRGLLASENPHSAVEPMSAALAQFPEQASLKTLDSEVSAVVRQFDAQAAARKVRDALGKRDWSSADSAVNELEATYGADAASSALSKEIQQATQARKKSLDEAAAGVRSLIAANDFVSAISAVEALNLSEEESAGFQELSTRARSGLEKQLFQKRFEELRDKVSSALDRGEIESALKLIAEARAEYEKHPAFAELEAKVQRERDISAAVDKALEKVGAREWTQAIEYLESKIKEFGKDRRFLDLIAQIQEERNERHKAAQAAQAQARELFDAGQYEQSIERLSQAVRDFPDEPALPGALEKLREEHAAVLRQARHEAAEAALAEARSLFQTGQHEQSIERLTQAVREFPDEPALPGALEKLREEHAAFLRQARHEAAEAALAEARSLFESGQHEQSIERLTKAVKDFPDEPALTEALAKLREEHATVLRQARHKAAEAALAEARSLFASGRHERSIERLTQAVHEFPDEPALAEALAKLRDEHAAVLRETRHRAAEAALAEARSLFESGQHEQSIERLSQAVNEFPDEPTLAAALEKLRQEHAAVLRQARHKAAEAALAEARSLFESGKHKQSIDRLTKAVKDFPDEPTLADALEKLREELAAVLRQARHKAAEAALAEARSLFESGRHEQSIERLSQAVHEFPDEPTLADALAKLREEHTAVLRQARHKAAEAALAEARSLFESGQHEQSIDRLIQAVNDFPDEPTLAEALKKFRKDRAALARQAKVREIADRARSLLAANKAAGAEVLLQHALEDFKGEPSLEKLLTQARAAHRRSDELKNCADTVQAWLKNGNAAQAESILLEGLRRFPNEPSLTSLQPAVSDALAGEAVAGVNQQLATGRLADAKSSLAAAIEKHGQDPKLTTLADEIEQAEHRKATITQTIAVAAQHLDSGKVQDAIAILDKVPAWVANDPAAVELRERCQRLLTWQTDESQKISARVDALNEQGLFDEAVALLESASSEPRLQPLLLPLLDRCRKIQASAVQQLSKVRQAREQNGPSGALEVIRSTGPGTRRHPDFARLREQYERELREMGAPTRITPIPEPPPSAPKPTVVAPVPQPPPQPATAPARKFPPAALWGGLAVVGLAVVFLVKSLLSPAAPHSPATTTPPVSTAAPVQQKAPESAPQSTPSAPPQIVGDLSVTARQISVDYQIPNPFPQPHRVSVTNPSGPIAFSATVVKGAEWLSVTQDRTTTPATVIATYKLSGLKAGSYEGLIRCTPSTGRSATIAVNLTIHAFSIR